MIRSSHNEPLMKDFPSQASRYKNEEYACYIHLAKKKFALVDWRLVFFH